MVHSKLHFAGDLIILSDSHLNSDLLEKPGKTETDLIRVLEYCDRHSTSLLLLGDIFDYWMEYPGRVPGVAPLFREHLTAFLKKNRSPEFLNHEKSCGDGISKEPFVLMVTGNHDNWTREHFPSIGLPLYHEHIEGTWPETSAFFLHGDGLRDPKFELPRPLFHRFLRHPLFVRIYQSILPEKTGLRIMKWFSEKSRAHSKPSIHRLNQFAEAYISNGLANVVISGHDHVARKIFFKNGVYLNCGSFHEQRTAVYYTNGEFSLVKWEHNQFVSYH